jgi:hypothetical protein
MRRNCDGEGEDGGGLVLRASTPASNAAVRSFQRRRAAMWIQKKNATRQRSLSSLLNAALVMADQGDAYSVRHLDDARFRYHNVNCPIASVLVYEAERCIKPAAVRCRLLREFQLIL